MMKNKTQLEILYSDKLKGKRFFTSDFKIRWNEMDLNGHINYANYLDYYSEARLEAMGHDTFNVLNQQGLGPVVYKAELDFIKELRHPDTAHIVTWVDQTIGKTRVAVNQQIYSTDKITLVSAARFLIFFMDVNKRKPVPMPDILKKKFDL